MIGNEFFIPGQETESKLPESCIKGFQRLLIITNFNPVHVWIVNGIHRGSFYRFSFSC